MHTIQPARLKPGVSRDSVAASTSPTSSISPDASAVLIRGKALIFWDLKVLGKKKKLDAIDTDQITPAADCVSESLDTLDERWKAGSFRYLMPDFRARVVVNERTGTVVSGVNVQIASAAISYGDLKISIVTDNTVSQPTLLVNPSAAIRTQIVSNSHIDLQEQHGATLLTQPGGTIADLMQALGKLGISARDVVSVLKALKASGALHAELVVQ